MIMGKYHLKELLGVGGMAEVFRAERRGVGGFYRTVALKRILPQFLQKEDFQRMFIDEARVCATLIHSNVVQIFDFDKTEDGSYFFTMEIVEGIDLRKLLDAISPNPLSVTFSLLVASEVLRGLAYAHERTLHGQPLGLIHRDVTPSNILLSWAGEVKLSDFGLARTKMRASITRPGFVKGKYAYLAPEQLQGEEIDHRVDLFALGVVLWECLTGQRLFWAPTDMETLKNLLEKEALPPSKVCTTVPEICDEVVLSLLQKDPDKRASKARDVMTKVGDLLHLLATRSSHVDLSLFLEQLFPRDLQGQHMVELAQKGKEGEETREIDGRTFLELSKSIPSFPAASPIFANARQDASRSAEISVSQQLEALLPRRTP